MADKISKDDGKPPVYLFLSDPGHRVIDRYGLLNPDGRGWPHPATFVIDRQSIVRWKFVEVDYRVRARATSRSSKPSDGCVTEPATWCDIGGPLFLARPSSRRVRPRAGARLGPTTSRPAPSAPPLTSVSDGRGPAHRGGP